MAGSKQKHPSALVGHRSVPNLKTVGAPPEHVDPPKPPPAMGWSKHSLDEWDRIWNTPQASAWDWASAYALVVGYMNCYEDLNRFQRAVRRTPITKGSTGQVVAHPLMREIDALRTQMLKYADALWLSPSGAIKGGIELRRAESELERLNRSLAEAEAQARKEEGEVPDGWDVVDPDDVEDGEYTEAG